MGDLLGEFVATAYGPPWGGINGTGVTAGGTDLSRGQPAYLVAVDPSVIPLGTQLTIQPNPFGYSGPFLADDTGGAIKGQRLDFYDWRGRAKQLQWGERSVRVWRGADGPSSSPTKPGGMAGIGQGDAGGVVSSEQRSGALKALVWILLVLGGATLAALGTARLAGAGGGDSGG